MLVFVLLALFILGAVVASFVGVIVARLNTGQSFVGGRSQCDVCGAELQGLALVPILAFIASGGRSLCCSSRISVWSPLSEVLLGALFVLSYMRLGLTPSLACMLIAISLLLALVLYDLAHQILPTPLLLSFIIAAILTGFLQASSLQAFLPTLYTAMLLSLILLALHVFSKGRAMGFADAPFVFGCSLLVGSAALTGFIFSFWIGAAVGIVILLKRPAGSRMGVEVPFAPFLAAGYLLAYFTQWNLFSLLARWPR